MRMKRFIVGVMTLALLLTGVISNEATVKAVMESTVKLNEEMEELVVKPGETKHVKIPVISVGNALLMVDGSIIDHSESSVFTFTEPYFTVGDNLPVNSIYTSGTTYVEFDMTVKETATTNIYPLTLKLNAGDLWDEPVEATLDFKVKILEEKIPTQLTVSGISLKKTVAGSDTDLTFTIKNEGEITARNTYLNLDYLQSGIVKRYSLKNIKIGDLTPGETKEVTLPVSILSNAEPGLKSLIANFEYKMLDGTLLEDSSSITVKVDENGDAPDINLNKVKYVGDLKPGNEFTLEIVLQNGGGSKAENVSVSIDPSSLGTESFMKNFFTEDIPAGDMKVNAKRTVEIPLLVSKRASGDVKELIVHISYTDKFGKIHDKTKTIYPEIIGSVVVPDPVPNIIVNNVEQYPANPEAGEPMEVSFDIVNKSAADITELKIATVFAANTFIPIDSEPYQYIDLLKGKETRRITIPLIVSDMVTEGLNNLTVNIDYNGGSVDGGAVTIPVLNVQNNIGSSSTPKLIVSKYSADVEEIRAGSTFNFTFDIYNTNSSITAKNITVTVIQQENVFSVTQGSNSFFINKLSPEETVQNTLELKVKSDATTKAYPITLRLEYEYDGAEPNPQTGEIGETKDLELNLQVVENSRPVVDNVNVYSYDGMVTMGNPAFLSFEFYNMGRSPLNNVVATVEGDFMKTSGDMYFIGNVMEGSSNYVEFEVLPNLEGQARGVMKVTFEDSNGDKIEYTKDFETFVNGAPVFDPGMGGDWDSGEVFNPSPIAKKPIMKTWMFIAMEVVIFILFIPITYKIIIHTYKNKLRKREEERY